MSLRWDDMQLFLAVHDTGSLSGAARALGLGQPTLSRRIAELEALLGEALFVRESQGTRLTAAGRDLLPAAQGMATWASEAALGVGKQRHRPEGKVRIAAPPAIAYAVLTPLATRLRRREPQIQLEVLSGVETLNLARGEADLSLRTRRPSDDDLCCVDEITSGFAAYGAPDYARGLRDGYGLADLDWICWAPPYDQLGSEFELSKSVPGFRPAFSSDDLLVQIAACQNGAGAMVLPRLLHRYALLRELVELDVDLGCAGQGALYLVCHKRHRHVAKIALTIDIIHAEFARLRGDEGNAYD